MENDQQKYGKSKRKGLYPIIVPDTDCQEKEKTQEKVNYRGQLFSKLMNKKASTSFFNTDINKDEDSSDATIPQKIVRSVSEDRSGRDSNWVCPDDRQLALRAKIRIGWSVRAEAYDKFGAKPKPLSDSEKEIIASVIKRAEAVEKQEQERIGMLVERLDNIKMRRVVPNTEVKYRCSLCGDKLGILGSSSMLCHDCNKAVCTKCGIETSIVKQKMQICLCKICAETREMWKKSGAWFYKSIPKYVLPVKTNPFPNNYRRYEREPLWKRASERKCDDDDDDDESSSDDEIRTTISAPASLAKPKPNRSPPLSPSSNRGTPLNQNYSPKPAKVTFNESNIMMKNYDKPLHRKESFDSVSSRNTQSTESCGSLPQICVNYCVIDGSFEITNRDSSGSEKSPCSDVTSGFNRNYNEDAHDSRKALQQKSSGSNLGLIRFSLQYDVDANSLHISLHKAEKLKGQDIHGLSDPFCKLNLFPVGAKSYRLRTRTVHRTVNPEFNETLTFYGIVDDKISSQSLHILILDDDKYGHDCLGEAIFPLHLLEPKIRMDLHLNLTEHIPSTSEDEVWGEGTSSNGQIVLTLLYSTRKRALIVGIVKCMNLIPMDSNGLSDPFIKLWLRTPQGCSSKYRTSIKWKDLNPIYNEEFILDTKITDLSTKTLVITVWDKDPGRRNDYLGCLELGLNSKGERLHQWISAIKFPDRKHEGVHNLNDQLLKE